MGTLENRIKTIETKLLTGGDEQPEGIFYVFEDASMNAGAPETVKGWQFNETRIMRRSGETDEELSRRAITEVRPGIPKNVIPVFFPIS